jgi:hypothetical protein
MNYNLKQREYYFVSYELWHMVVIYQIIVAHMQNSPVEATS